ncbi:MAG: hypothetical protein LRY55_12350 [Leadbetterella sp.]|nr:hypothetical protein [Leadbetterella sp.]
MAETDFVKFDRNKPLLVDGNGGGADILLYQSVVTRMIPGANGVLTKGNRVMMANATIHDLFREAYSDTIRWPYNRVLSTLSDSLNEKIFWPAYAFKSDYASIMLTKNWRENNSYCYSLTLPHKLSRAEGLQIAQADLNRFFGEYMGINVALENRLVKCLVFTRLAGKDISIPEKGVSEFKGDDNNTYFRFDNRSFRNFVSLFAERNKYSPLPIVNETGYKGNISMEFKGPLTDLSMVREELQRNGFDLIEKDVNINMLVFYSVNNKNL